MSAAAKRKQAPTKGQKAGHLTLAPQEDTYQSVDIAVDSTVQADLSLEIEEGDLTIGVDVSIELREWCIARGEPIIGRLHIPDYESTEPHSHVHPPIAVQIAELEALGHAIVKLGQQAKRFGFVPAQEG
jgi:hypothetical protein